MDALLSELPVSRKKTLSKCTLKSRCSQQKPTLQIPQQKLGTLPDQKDALANPDHGTAVVKIVVEQPSSSFGSSVSLSSKSTLNGEEKDTQCTIDREKKAVLGGWKPVYGRTARETKQVSEMYVCNSLTHSYNCVFTSTYCIKSVSLLITLLVIPS